MSLRPKQGKSLEDKTKIRIQLEFKTKRNENVLRSRQRWIIIRSKKVLYSINQADRPLKLMKMYVIFPSVGTLYPKFRRGVFRMESCLSRSSKVSTIELLAPTIFLEQKQVQDQIY